VSRQATGSWGRAIEAVGSRRHRAGYGAYSGNARAWCFIHATTHFIADCPVTPQEFERTKAERLGRTP
jgi:hypothetical protein